MAAGQSRDMMITLELPPPPPSNPFYQRWWFWSGVAVAVAAASAIVFWPHTQGPLVGTTSTPTRTSRSDPCARCCYLVPLLAAMAGGCNKSRTEVIIGLATDLIAPTPLSSVDMRIYDLDGPSPSGTVISDQSFQISGVRDQAYELPGTFAVYSASGSADRFRAVLTATEKSGATLVVRSAVMNLIPEKTLFVRLGTVSACRG